VKSGFLLCNLILAYDCPSTQDKNPFCPFCLGYLHRHGSCSRQYISQGQKQYCQVERFYCPACYKSFTRLPPFLLPFKRYTADEIEMALQHLADGGTLAQAPGEADERTLRRWWQEFRPKVQDWTGQLEAILFHLRQRVSNLTRLAVNPLGRLKAILDKYAGLPSHWTLLVKALYWLQKSHPHCLG
jgi:hypothetical protein